MQMDEVDYRTIIFDSNSGDSENHSERIVRGAMYKMSDVVPSKAGYRFTGWSANRFAAEGEIHQNDVIGIECDVTLYAIWTPCGDLVVLSDAGIDDSIALWKIFKNHDYFDSITVISIAGNVSEDKALINVRKVVELAGLQNKVKIVSSSDVKQRTGDATAIHGNDGLGDIGLPEPTVPYIQFGQWIEDVKHIDHLAVTGPHTVAKLILDSKHVSNCVFMGGFVNAQTFPGMEEYDFNVLLDVGAFESDVRRRHVTATLDTGEFGKPLDVKDLKDIPDTPIGVIAGKYIDNCIAFKDPFICMWDDIVAEYLIHPHYFAIRPMVDKHGNVLNSLEYINPEYELILR